MFGQSLLSAFGIACTTDTDQLFATNQSATSIATYQLNSGVTSIPNNTYPGTATSISYTAGKFGNAAVFDGSSSDIIISGLSSMFSTKAAFTVSLWFKTTATGNRALFDDYTSNNYNIQLYLYDGILNVSTRFSGGDGNMTASSTTYNDGNWHHVAVTSNQTTYNTYVDGGSPITWTPSSNSHSGQTPTVTTGASQGGTVNFFSGEIDQLRIFNSALPQAAITALYNETATTATSASIDYQLANPNSIAYYKMSNATDQLGNYNGTATNVNFNTEGKFGFAGAFNGSSSKIALPNNLVNSISPQEFSVSFWFNSNNLTTYQQAFSAYENASGVNYGWQIFTGYPQSKLKFQSYSSNGNMDFQGATTLSVNTWYHCVLTYPGGSGTAKLYLNGSEDGSETIPGDRTYAPNNAYYIGAASNGAGGTEAHYNGKIDQIRIYDSALSAADVSTLYKEVECEPAAINALDHFNTVLYDGTGGSQSTNSLSNQVGTLGFASGMTWLKSRSNATWHEVHDVVRGNLPRIFPNDTSQELTSANGFASLNSNGFSLDSAGGGGDVNTSGRTYVAWNWKAPLANLSTSFNGSSSKIEVTNSGNVFEAVGGFSASVWVNRNTTANQTILNKEGGVSGSYGWSLRYTSGAGYSYDLYDTSNNQVTVSTGANSTTATWEHVAISFNNSDNKLRIYYNGGTPVVSSALSSAASSNTENFFIGARTNSGIVTDGNLAQVRIYSTAVTDAQVSDLYAEPATSNNTLNYPAGAGCIAAYPLQTDAVDLSGNYSGASSNVTFGQPGYLTGNTEGTIPSTVAVDQAAGFSIVKYTTSGVQSIGHGLSSAPELIIQKTLNVSGGSYWAVYSLPTGTGKLLRLNENSSVFTDSSFMTAVGNSTFTTSWSGTSYDYINYCFKSIPGYSRIGSYAGNLTTPPSITTGFSPRFLMIKKIDNGTGPWVIIDSGRAPTNPASARLRANTPDAEYSNSAEGIYRSSTGFTVGTVGNLNTWDAMNANSTNYLYLAIA